MIDWDKFKDGWATGSMKCRKCDKVFSQVRFRYSCHDKVEGEWPMCCGEHTGFMPDWEPESMSGPISITTISGDSEPVECHEYQLVLKIPMRFYEEDLDPRTAQALQNVLRDWRDGRHPFYAEMVTEGLWKCLTSALQRCIVEDCQKEFGREMVQVSEGHQASRWNLEAQKRKPNLPYMSEEIEVEIVRN